MAVGRKSDGVAGSVSFDSAEVEEWLSLLRPRRSEERFFRSQFRGRPEVMRELIQAGPAAVRLFLMFAPRRQFEVRDPRNVVGQLRGWCKEAGVGKAGWRWMLRLPPRFAMDLLRNAIPSTNLLGQILPPLARAGDPPPDAADLWREILMARELFEIPGDVLPGMLRAVYRAWREAGSGEERRRIRRQELPLVTDWLVCARPELDKNQVKAPWSGWVRRQAQWHEEMRLLARARECGAWKKVAGDCTVDGYRFTELNSVVSLAEEGRVMDHCLGQGRLHPEQARKGVSIFFAVEPADRAVSINSPHRASLQLYWWNEEWVVRQCHGSGNSEVDERLRAAAARLARRLPPFQGPVVPLAEEPPLVASGGPGL